MGKPKTVGELNGRWAFLFKLNQVLWTLTLPILLAVMLQWMPWVSRETILNEQYRKAEPERRETLKEWSRGQFMPRPGHGAVMTTNPVPSLAVGRPSTPRLN